MDFNASKAQLPPDISKMEISVCAEQSHQITGVLEASWTSAVRCKQDDMVTYKEGVCRDVLAVRSSAREVSPEDGNNKRH